MQKKPLKEIINEQITHFKTFKNDTIKTNYKSK